MDDKIVLSDGYPIYLNPNQFYHNQDFKFGSEEYGFKVY